MNNMAMIKDKDKVQGADLFRGHLGRGWDHRRRHWKSQEVPFPGWCGI